MMATPAVREELVALTLREARLLDDRQYTEWLALFSADGHYWIPLSHDQRDPINEASLMYEDKLLLRIRIERLMADKAHSQQPQSRSLHVLQQPTFESVEGTDYVTRCAFSYFEARGEEQHVLAAVAWHRWVQAESGLRLRQKRVHLLNSDAALPSIQLFM